MENNLYASLLDNLRQYKRKYYLNRFVRGSLITVGLLSTVFLGIALVEYYGRFNSTIRLILFLVWSATLAYTLWSWIILPLYHLKNNHTILTDEEASRQLGKHFPEIKDKLLNTLQLSKQSSDTNALVIASIQQKSKEIQQYDFTSAIRLSENRKYLRWAFPPLLLIISGLIFFPSLFSESTNRIIQFNRQFSTPAPFIFRWTSDKPLLYRNDNVTIELELVGDALPTEAYMEHQGQRLLMRSLGNGRFAYTLHNVQRTIPFYFEAAGFTSDTYEISIHQKPDVRNFELKLEYPSYLKRNSETLQNIGNVTVPEGTYATWNFEAVDTRDLRLLFDQGSPKQLIATPLRDRYQAQKRWVQSGAYQVVLTSPDKGVSDPIRYSVTVQKDQFPSIQVEEVKDTLLRRFIQFGGVASDDYGMTKLQLVYSIQNASGSSGPTKTQRIPQSLEGTSTSFYYKWLLDSLSLKEGETLRYHFELFDNDGVNGAKKSVSQHFSWTMPTAESQQKALQQQRASTMEAYQKLVKQSAQIQKEMQQTDERIRTKKSLNWQDKKSLEDLVQKHKQLQQNVEQLNQELEQLQQQEQKFDPLTEELAKQMEQLQQMLDKMMDEEMKKKIEELEKLLQQNVNKEQLEELLKKINQDDQYLKQELNRQMEMYKQMEFQKDLEQATKKLEELQKQQEDLSKKTLENKTAPDALKKEQDALNQSFDSFTEEMKDLEKQNQELQDPMEMQPLQEQQEGIQQDMQNSSQQIQQQQNKKASDSQKNAAKKMEQMKQQMQQMQQQSGMQQAEENYQDLRQILDNLLYLSFSEESLMKQYKTVSQSDPRYVALSQQQLKLQDDSKIIKDSLMALAARVPQIQSFVTKELFEMNNYMEESMVKLKARRPELAVSDMQFAMTSMNNLALMLSEVLKQMQQDMNNMQMMMSNGKQCNKPKPGAQGQPKPKPGDMGKMQQELNQRIEQLKKSGASGQQLSEELAKLAAQQEALRKALQDLEKMMQEQGGGNSEQLKKLKELMEQTERDLVNKNISNETLMRQREILTRLLEAEKSVRERDWEDSREAQQAKPQEVVYPPSLEKYLRAKERQMELLKTVPPGYTPYYQQEVEEYFQQLQ